MDSSSPQATKSCDRLKSRIEEHKLPLAAFEWYLDHAATAPSPTPASAWTSNA
jgi:aspartyl/asparaginyl-tRNA synthetase